MSMPQSGGPGPSWEGQPAPGAGQGGSVQGQPSEQARYGQPQYGQQPSSYPGGGPMQGRPISPVNEIETRITGKRFLQYIVDFIVSAIGFSLLGWALNRGTGGAHAVLVLIWVLADIAWYFLYWAYVPFVRAGQTLGMTLLNIRVISADGGPASLVQLFVRSILLVLFPWASALVGWVVMMCSRYRQRTGDHMAKTMVVRASITPEPAPTEFAGAGQAGTR